MDESVSCAFTSNSDDSKCDLLPSTLYRWIVANVRVIEGHTLLNFPRKLAHSDCSVLLVRGYIGLLLATAWEITPWIILLKQCWRTYWIVAAIYIARTSTPDAVGTWWLYIGGFIYWKVRREKGKGVRLECGTSRNNYHPVDFCKRPHSYYWAFWIMTVTMTQALYFLSLPH